MDRLSRCGMKRKRPNGGGGTAWRDKGAAMLLYDRVREQILLADRRSPNWFGSLSQLGADICQSFLGSTVFEVSDVFSLIDDWSRERDRPVPKRPPFQVIWCEWDCEQKLDKGVIDWTIGTHFCHWPAGQEADRIMRKVCCPDNWLGCDHFGWISVRYIKGAKKTADSDFDFNDLRGTWFVDPFCSRGAIRTDGRPVGFEAFGLESELVIEKGGGARLFRPFANAPIFPDGGGYFSKAMCEASSAYFPWPAFMAFALLHCKNVETETHDYTPAQRNAVRRSGNPPRTVYKTLKIKLPQIATKHRTLADHSEEDERRMRFHLCRGHFKNLQHERYKVKGLHWWPAHWRGSQEAGRVEKTYSLQPSLDNLKPSCHTD